MFKSYIYKISIFILCFCLLTSCHSEDDSGHGIESSNSTHQSDNFHAMDLSAYHDDLRYAEKHTAEHVYRFVSLPKLPDGTSYNGFANITVIDYEAYTVMRTVNRSDTSVVFGTILLRNGQSDAEITPYDITNLLLSWEKLGYFSVCANGELLITTYCPNPDDGEGRLIRCTSDGVVLAENAIPGNGTNKNASVTADGRIVVAAENRVCIYDNELKLIAVVLCSNAERLLISPRGEILCSGNILGQYSRIDPDSQIADRDHVYLPPESLASPANLYFSPVETAYDAYFSDSTGFWGYTADHNSAELLCDWKQSGFLYHEIEICAVIDPNTLFVRCQNLLTKEMEYGFFIREQNASTERIKITVGLIDSMQKCGLGAQYGLLEDAIRRFNMMQTYYYAELVPYYTEYDETGTVPTAFTDAILSGTAADLLVHTSNIREEILSYEEKYAFTDVSDIMSEILLPSILSAYRTSDHSLYAVPIQTRLTLFAIKNDILPESAELNLDVLYQLSKQSDNHISLFNNYLYSAAPKMAHHMILSSALPSFADKATGTCSFDSAEFADLIQFYERASAYYSDDITSYFTYDSDYFVGSPEITEDLRNGNILLFEVPFSSMSAYPVLKLLYGDTAFSLHGYPQKDGETPWLFADVDVRINASSPLQLGAMQVLSYLLSDEIQTLPRLTDTSFPVTKTALDVLLQQETFYFSDTVFYKDPNGRYGIRQYKNKLSKNCMEVSLSIEERDMIRQLFYDTQMQSVSDPTMTSIIEEELSAYQAGIRSLEETQKILQSRLYIYVNE